MQLAIPPLIRRNMNFFRCVICYLLVISLIGGEIVSSYSPGVSYLDGLFLAVSAVTGTGLGTVNMRDLSTESFVTLYILMFMGGTTMLLLPPMLYRRLVFGNLYPSLKEFVDQQKQSENPSVQFLAAALQKRERLNRAIGVTAVVIILYLFFWLFIGSFIMYGISTLYEDPAEIKARGFTKLWTACFLAASSFFNCGYALTSDSLMSYGTQPGVYLWACLLILAGNTAAPMCLRGLLRLTHHWAGALRLDREALRFALDNPRLVTTHLFDSRQNFLLVLLLLVINITEYIFFLGSDLNRELMQVYGDKATIAGIGFFQTISTRSAGLQVVDLRHANQGMLMVYIFTMYIAAAPFVSRMHVSEQHIDDKGETQHTYDDSASAWQRFSNGYLFRHTAALYVAVMICCFAEDLRYSESEMEIFYIIFEIVSSYGNVGLSMGFPGQNYSLAGAMTSLSKVVLMVVMLMGKVRGLPAHTDIIVDFQFKELKKALQNAIEDMSVHGQEGSPRTSSPTIFPDLLSPPPVPPLQGPDLIRHSMEIARNTLFSATLSSRSMDGVRRVGGDVEITHGGVHGMFNKDGIMRRAQTLGAKKAKPLARSVSRVIEEPANETTFEEAREILRSTWNTIPIAMTRRMSADAQAGLANGAGLGDGALRPGADRSGDRGVSGAAGGAASREPGADSDSEGENGSDPVFVKTASV